MKIHTIDLLNDDINMSSHQEKPTIFNSNESIENIISFKHKAIDLLIKEPRTTKQITDMLKCAPRTARQTLSRLEKTGIVKRNRGRKINDSFRFSDKWHINKPIETIKNVPENKTCIAYKNYNSSVYYKFIPNEIDVNELVVSSCGLIEAEATKTKPHALDFVNSEPMIINRITDFLRYLDVNISDVRWRIIFSGNLRKFYTEHEEEICRKYWIKNTHLLLDNERNASPSYVKYISKTIRDNLMLSGSMNIYHTNTILCKLIFSLLNKIKEFAIKDEKISLWYLKGYLVGEAYVGKKDRQIQIASVSDDDLQILKKCLENLGVSSYFSKTTSTSPKRLIIGRIDNFIKLYKCGVMDMHPYKKRALLTKMLVYKNIDDVLRKQIEQDLESINEFIEKRDSEFKKLRILM